MITFRLVIFPGGVEGIKEVAPGTTLATVAEQFSVSDRDLCYNGRKVPQAEWASVTVVSGSEVAALESSKGNA